MRKTLKILFLAVMLLVMVGMTMLFASAEGPFQVTISDTAETFDTLSAAVDAATTNGVDTITITGETDIVLDSDVTFMGENLQGKILIDAAVTIDVGSYTLSFYTITVNEGGSLTITGGADGEIAAAGMSSYGTMTITDGVYTLSGSIPVRAYVGGTVDVQGGDFTFTNASSNGFYTTAAKSGTKDTVATLKIAAGVEAKSEKYVINLANYRMAEINGGTFTGLVSAAGAYSKLTVNGGTFTFNTFSTSGTLTLNGGTFIGGTLKPAKALTIGGEVSLQVDAFTGVSITVSEGGSLSVPADAGSFTLSDSKPFNVSPGGYADIQGGTWSFTGSSAYSFYATAASEAESEYCLILGEKVKMDPTIMPSYSLVVYNGRKVKIEGGEYRGRVYVADRLDIVDGTFTASATGILMSVTSRSSAYGTVTVQNGTFTGPIVTVGANCSLTVKDGTFNVVGSPSGTNANLAIKNSGSLEIEKGTFTTGTIQVEETGSLTVEGGSFTLKAADEKITVDEVEYTFAGTGSINVIGSANITGGTFAAVNVAVNAGASLTVVNEDTEFTLSSNIAVNGSVDIQGGTFTATAFVVNDGGSLKITDGEFPLSSQYPVRIHVGGTADIKGGTFTFTNEDTFGIFADEKENDGVYSVDETYTVTLGTDVIVDSALEAMVIRRGRMVKIEGGKYEGRTRIQGGTLDIAGGTFINEKGLVLLEQTRGEHPGVVTVSNDATFTGQSVEVRDDSSLTVNGGTFELTDNDGKFFNITGSLSISAGTFKVTGSGNLFVANVTVETEGVPTETGATIEVTGGNFTVQNGAAVAQSFAGITFDSDPEAEEKTLTFTIGTGSVAPSADVEGAEDQVGYAYWIIKSWNMFEIADDVTINSMADCREPFQAFVESYLENYNAFLEIGYNCEVDIEVTEWIPIVVVADGKLTLQGIDLAISGAFVTVQTGGELILEDSIFTATADLPFIVLDGGSVTLNNVKATVQTFMSGENGTLNVVDLFLIVTGEDEVIFDVTAAITKVVVVANTKTMSADVSLGDYAAQVKYGGKLHNAWVKLPATAAVSTDMVEGAAIEVTNPEMAGLRFVSTVSSNLANYLKQTYTSGESFIFGTLIAPADYVATAGEFTIDKLNELDVEIPYVDIPATLEADGGSMVDKDGDGIAEQFSGALVNLKSYTRAYAAVSYVKVVRENGEVAEMIYGAFDSTVNARTAQEIALAILDGLETIEEEDNTYYLTAKGTVLDGAQKAIVDKYASGVVSE